MDNHGTSMTEELPKLGTHLIIFPLICLGLLETQVKLFMPKASSNNEFCNCRRCWVQTHLALVLSEHNLMSPNFCAAQQNESPCPVCFLHTTHHFLDPITFFLSEITSDWMKAFTLTDPHTEAITYFLSYSLAFPVLSQLQLILLEKGKPNCTWHLTYQGFIKQQ